MSDANSSKPRAVSPARPASAATPAAVVSPAAPARITSIDALRGLVMFTMIFVNDIAGASHKIVPWWMRHFSESEKGSGMTFVDLVFPAFLFIVGMSIPFALGSRLAKGEPAWRVFLHVVPRSAALIFLGILMVNNESPLKARPGWNPTLWAALMFGCAIVAFCQLSPPREATASLGTRRAFHILSWLLRVAGLAGLVVLAFQFQGEHEKGEDVGRIITLSPFSIHTDWYGILGLIGWAYLVAATAFLIFRTNRTALLGVVVVLMSLYPAMKKDLFGHFHVQPALWLNDIVNLGETLGSQAAITVAGVLLATILLTPDTRTTQSRARFTLLFVAGFSLAAFLLHLPYGINKNAATPSWCLWACAITAALWLLFYFVCDVWRVRVIAKPLSLAGQNVLLAYLLHNLFYPAMELAGADPWYGELASADLLHAICRSLGIATLIVSLAVVLNRIGLRLKL